jgi:hypothetical protein
MARRRERAVELRPVRATDELEVRRLRVEELEVVSERPTST